MKEIEALVERHSSLIDSANDLERIAQHAHTAAGEDRMEAENLVQSIEGEIYRQFSQFLDRVNPTLPANRRVTHWSVSYFPKHGENIPALAIVYVEKIDHIGLCVDRHSYRQKEYTLSDDLLVLREFGKELSTVSVSVYRACYPASTRRMGCT